MSTPEDENTPQQPAADGTPTGDVPPTAPPVPPTAPPAPPAAAPVPPAAPPAPPAAPTAPAGGTPPPAAPPAPGAFPAYSGTAAAPVAAPTAAPTTVNASFWLYIVATVFSVISGVIGLSVISSTRQTVIDQIQRQGTTINGQSIDQIADAAIAIGTATIIVVMIFWVVVYVLFAFLMRRGANWARIVLTVLTVLSLFNVLGGFGTGFVQFAASLVAVILMWLPASSQWFAAIKASKAPRA